MIFSDVFRFIIQGIIFATLIDTIGSIASRKLSFNYTYLAPLSLLNYSSIGYYASESSGLKAALFVSFIVGLYDATIGVWLALKLMANYEFNEEDEKFASHPFAMLFLVGVALLFGFIGHLFA